MKKAASAIRSISLLASLGVTSFLLGVGGLAIGVSRHNSKIARLVASLKPTPIGSATDSLVAWEGTVKAINDRMLVAPATHTRSCWFRVTVEELSDPDSNNENEEWITISEYASTAPFLIQDATGQAAVYPFRAAITPTDRSVWHGSTAIPQDRNPPRFGPGESPTIFHFKSDGEPPYRYTEERIYCGDRLYALGTFKSSTAQPADNQKDDSAATQPEERDWRLASPAEQRGAVTSGQWLGRNRFKELDRMVKAITSKRLIATDYKQPFLLSAVPREKLVEANRGGSRAALFFAAFPFGLASVFLWFRFGWRLRN